MFACKKENTIPERFTPVPASNTSVKFLNLSPGSPSVNFYVNGAKATAFAPTSAGAVTGMAYNGSYPSTSGYATLPSGALKMEAIVIPSSSVGAGTTLNTFTREFNSGKFYTVVLVDTFTSVAPIVIEDDPSVPDPGKAYFRIANFSAGSPYKVEVMKTSTGYSYSKTFASVAAKSVVAYDTLGSGSGQVYKVYLRNAATDEKLDSIVNFAPLQSKKYTVYIRGGKATTGTTRPIISNYVNF